MRREVKIGIFAVLMIGALWAGIRFLKGFDIFSRNAVYYAAYDQVDGVQNASPILIRGVKVGAVTDISTASGAPKRSKSLWAMPEPTCNPGTPSVRAAARA